MHGADFIKLKRHIISLSLCLWFHFQDNINCKLKNSLIYSRSEQMKTLLNLMYPSLCGLRVNCLTLHFWILYDILNYEIKFETEKPKHTHEFYFTHFSVDKMGLLYEMLMFRSIF